LVENSLSFLTTSETQDFKPNRNLGTKEDKFEEFLRISLQIGCIGHLKFITLMAAFPQWYRKHDMNKKLLEKTMSKMHIAHLTTSLGYCALEKTW